MVKSKRFTEPLDVRIHGLRQYEMLSEISFLVTKVPEDIIVVPIGFQTDLATVPRFLWTLFPPLDKYAKAAVVHDYMYVNGLRTKKEADMIFLQGMKDLGVSKFKRTLIFLAVRFFGRGNY